MRKIHGQPMWVTMKPAQGRTHGEAEGHGHHVQAQGPASLARGEGGGHDGCAGGKYHRPPDTLQHPPRDEGEAVEARGHHHGEDPEQQHAEPVDPVEPHFSAHRPMGMRRMVTMRMYEVCAQRASLNVNCRSAEMVGRATAKMLESSEAMNSPMDEMRSTRQRS